MSNQSFIFQTRIDNLTRAEILQSIDTFLAHKEFRQIATVNPEFLLQARKDEAFQKTLNSCSLNVADGFGLHVALWRKGEHLLSRIAGADIMTYVLQQAEKKKLRVFCLVRADGLSQWSDVKRALKKQFPALRMDGFEMSHTHSFDMLRATLQDRIKTSDIILCNFGAPQQEFFLAGLRNTKSIIRVAIGIGGSFDFLTQKIQRAPQFMRRCGLEWLWRLIQQPSRFQRIINAVIVFPLLVLFKSR